MSNNLVSNLPNISQNKIPNLKEFIKYLDQTLKMFDQHIAEEEFENKNSDVYKLFVTLFNIYTDLDVKKTRKNDNPKNNMLEICQNKYEQNNDNQNNDNQNNKNIIDNVEINSIIQQHIENRKKNKNANPKWENNRTNLDSDKQAREIYNKSMMELKTSENNGPILFSNAKHNKISSPVKNTSSKSTPFGDIRSTLSGDIRSTSPNNSNHIVHHTGNKKLRNTKQMQTIRKKEIMSCSTKKGCNEKYYNSYTNETDQTDQTDEFENNIIKTDSDIDNSDIYTDYDGSESEIITHIPAHKPSKKKIHYEKTDDIDKKISALKKILGR